MAEAEAKVDTQETSKETDSVSKTDTVSNEAKDVKSNDSNGSGEKTLEQIQDQEAQILLKQVKEKLRKVEMESALKVKDQLKEIMKEIAVLSGKVKDVQNAWVVALKVANEAHTNKNEPEDSRSVPKTALNEIETRLGRHFEEDMSTMKEGLKHMVFAHNHNADLMIRLKEVMNDARSYMEEKCKMNMPQWVEMMPFIQQFLHFYGERNREMAQIDPKLENLVYRLEAVENMMTRRMNMMPGDGAADRQRFEQRLQDQRHAYEDASRQQSAAQYQRQANIAAQQQAAYESQGGYDVRTAIQVGRQFTEGFQFQPQAGAAAFQQAAQAGAMGKDQRQQQPQIQQQANQGAGKAGKPGGKNATANKQQQQQQQPHTVNSAPSAKQRAMAAQMKGSQDQNMSNQNMNNGKGIQNNRGGKGGQQHDNGGWNMNQGGRGGGGGNNGGNGKRKGGNLSELTRF